MYLTAQFYYLKDYAAERKRGGFLHGNRLWDHATMWKRGDPEFHRTSCRAWGYAGGMLGPSHQTHSAIAPPDHHP